MKRLWLALCLLLVATPAHAIVGLGDFAASSTVYCPWNTNGANGASITRSTNGTVSVYERDTTTESTTGVTDNEDFDGKTGMHLVKIDTSADGTFYAAGREFVVAVTGATIDSQTVNAWLCSFSIARTGLGNAGVKVSSGTGSGQVSLSSGAVIVQTGTSTGQLDLSSGRVKDDKPAVVRYAIKKATANTIIYLYLEDERTGGPLTGVASNAPGLACYYARTDQGNAGATAISLTAGTRGSYTSGGWVEKDATNAKGWVELGLPTGVIATGAPAVTVTCAGASNMKPATALIELVDNVASDILQNPVGTYRKNVGSQRAHPIFLRSTTNPQNGVTGASVTVEVSQDGSAFTAVDGTVAEVGNGAYAFSPTDTDMNCDTCIFKATATSSVPFIFYIFTTE